MLIAQLITDKCRLHSSLSLTLLFSLLLFYFYRSQFEFDAIYSFRLFFCRLANIIKINDAYLQGATAVSALRLRLLVYCVRRLLVCCPPSEEFTCTSTAPFPARTYANTFSKVDCGCRSLCWLVLCKNIKKNVSKIYVFRIERWLIVLKRSRC